MKQKFTNQGGQALITLLFFSIIGIMIASAAVLIISNGGISTNREQLGELAYYTAEAGAENAMVRTLRNPSYTGETLLLNNGTATIQITGTNPYSILSKGQVGNLKRTIQVDISYDNDILSILSWKEIY